MASPRPPTPTGEQRGFTWTFDDTDRRTFSVRVKDASGWISERSIQVIASGGNRAPRSVGFSLEGVAGGRCVALQQSSFDDDSDGPRTYAWDTDDDGVFDDDQTTCFDAGTTYRIPCARRTPQRVDHHVAHLHGRVSAAGRLVHGGRRRAHVGLDRSGRRLDRLLRLGPRRRRRFDDATGPNTTATLPTRRVGLKVRDSRGDTGIRTCRWSSPGRRQRRRRRRRSRRP